MQGFFSSFSRFSCCGGPPLRHLTHDFMVRKLASLGTHVCHKPQIATVSHLERAKSLACSFAHRLESVRSSSPFCSRSFVVETWSNSTSIPPKNVSKSYLRSSSAPVRKRPTPQWLVPSSTPPPTDGPPKESGDRSLPPDTTSSRGIARAMESPLCLNTLGMVRAT